MVKALLFGIVSDGNFLQISKIFFDTWRCPPKVLLGRDVLQICSKFIGKHPCQSVISKKLICNFIEITLRHECSPGNLLHIFRTLSYKSTCRGLLLSETLTGTPLNCLQYLPWSVLRIVTLKNFVKSPRKHLAENPFLIKLENLLPSLFMGVPWNLS